MGKKPPGFPLAHLFVLLKYLIKWMWKRFEVQESMQKTERKKKAESRKTIPWFCCSWLLCLVCSLWEGSSDHSPSSHSGTGFELGTSLKCFSWFKVSFLNHHCIFLLLSSVFLVEHRIKGSFSGGISWLHLTMQSLAGCVRLPKECDAPLPHRKMQPLWRQDFHCATA